MNLTPRQLQMLELASHGATDTTIGFKLGKSVWTLREDWKKMFATLGAVNRAHAVALALRHGLIL